MTTARAFAVLLIASAIALVSGSLHAQGATTAFEDGLAKWKEDDFAGALPFFKQALAATGSPNARFYVARCLRDLGRLPEAFDEMTLTVKDARALANTEERYAKTRDAAASELAVLEGRVGQVIVALDATLVDAYVTLNGATLPKERVGVPVPVMPGAVEAVAQNPDGSRFVGSVEIAGGETKTITLSTAARVANPTPDVEPPDDVDAGPGWLTPLRGVGIAMLAVGVGGIILFAVENGVADERLKTLETECGGAACPDDPRYAQLIDEGETAQTVAGVGLGVGVAALLGGAALLIFGGPDEAEDAAVGFAPHAGGASLRLRF